ncbi:MAG TPA: hypothetical protein VGB63_13115 [Pedobacter sp.]|jgi:hypothetical protein
MFDDEDEKPKKENAPRWPQIVDLFSNEIAPARDWQDAEIIETLEGICVIFNKAFPGQVYVYEDMILALHAMRIEKDRNEHNGEYYYLAKWK